MHSKSLAFGLTLFSSFALLTASCTSPNPESVPPTASAPAPSEPVESAEDAPPAVAEQPQAEAPAEPAPAAEPESAPVAEAKPAVEPPPAPRSEPPVQPVTPVVQQPQSAGPALPPSGVVPPPSAEDSKTSMFGEPLYVNGKRVSDNQIKLYLIYGPCRAMFEIARSNIIIEDEVMRRATEGAEAEIRRREAEKPFSSPEARQAALEAEKKTQHQQIQEKFAVPDADIQKEKDRMMSDFTSNYPALDLQTEVNRSFRNDVWYTKQLRNTMYFERVFLPQNPNEWPAVTVEALREDSGDLLLNDAQQSYTDRKATAEKLGIAIPPDDPLYMQMMRDVVRTAIYRLVEFKTNGEGLPDSIALWADTNADGQADRVVTTEELWNEIKDSVSQTEIDEAKQWYVTTMATRDRLEKDGFLLSSDDCKKAIGAKVAQMENSIYNLESLAMTTYSFPSIEAYLQYFCLLESFSKLSEAKLQPGPAGELAQPLREFFEHSNRTMGLGQVDVEVMLIAAFDIGKFTWKKDGWNWAKKEATALHKQVEENVREYNEQRAKVLEAKAKGQEYKPEKEVLEPYRFWTQMMDDHCEYWDPPAPEEKGRMSNVGMKMKGRFGPHYRNDLISFIGESYFTEWVTGSSITDYVFYEQAEGTVAGPFRGPQGYYITRVLRRTPPTRGLNLSDPKHVEMLKADWLRYHFIRYAREAAEKADVKGFARA